MFRQQAGTVLGQDGIGLNVYGGWVGTTWGRCSRVPPRLSDQGEGGRPDTNHVPGAGLFIWTGSSVNGHICAGRADQCQPREESTQVCEVGGIQGVGVMDSILTGTLVHLDLAP